MSRFARRLQQASQHGALASTSVSVTDVTDTTATLHWTAVPGATGYLVGRDGIDSHDNGPAQFNDSSSTTSRQFIWLEPDTTYTLYCQPQPGGARQEIQVTTEAATVPDPSNPIADAGSLPVGQASYSVPSGAIFVATTGSDTSGSGTQSTPYRTLAKAVSAAATGSTIVVRGGVYNEGGDTQNQSYALGAEIDGGRQLTIQNYPNEAVWFDGSVPVTGGWTQSGSTWSTAYDRVYDRSPTFTHGESDGVGSDTGAGGWFLMPDKPQACWPDMVLYDGTQLEQVQSLSDVGPGKFYVDGHAGNDSSWFVGTKLYIGDNPSGHEVRYANKAKLLRTVDAGSSLTLRGVGIRRYASYNTGFGVLEFKEPASVENVWIEDVSASVTWLGGSGTNFTKITARRVGFDFVGTNKADDLVFDRMDIQQCNYAGFNSFGPAISAMKFAKCQRVTLKNSIISNNNTGGFWTDQTVDTPIVVNCLFESNVAPNVVFETSSDSILANCKIINGSTIPAFIHDSDTTRLYNNVFSGNSFGILGDPSDPTKQSTTEPQIKIRQTSRRYDIGTYSFCIDPRQPSTYYTDHPNHQWTINYVSIVNNVIANVGVNTYSMVIAANDSDATRDPNRTFQPDMHPTMDGNVYHWGDNKPPYPWATAGGYQQNPPVYQSLSALQAGTSPSLDTHSTFATSNPLDSNYQLIDTSLHANATGLPADIAALVGQPAGTKHIGCFW